VVTEPIPSGDAAGRTGLVDEQPSSPRFTLGDVLADAETLLSVDPDVSPV
jgi:hypothetical protein